MLFFSNDSVIWKCLCV